MSPDELATTLSSLQVPFWKDWGFWIGSIIGFAGLIFSALAFREAHLAKDAAVQAGRTVKIQTITIELTEIAQRLDKLDFDLEFATARDLLNEVNRRLRRLTAPFETVEKYSVACETLRAALDQAKLELEGARPKPDSDFVAPNAVYYGMQGHFATISGCVATLMGLFEAETIENPK